MNRAKFAPNSWSRSETYKLMYNYIHTALEFLDTPEQNDRCHDIAMSLYCSPTELVYLSDEEIAIRLYRWYVDDQYKDSLMAYIRKNNPNRPPIGFKTNVLAKYWVGTEPLN